MAVIRRFAGKDFIIPGGASLNVLTGADIIEGASISNLVIVGISEGSMGGGPANATDIDDAAKIIKVTSILEAKKNIRGGPGLDGVLAALNPSSDENGPGEVYFLRVNPATRAQSFLENSSVDIIQLDAKDYGVYLNGVKIDVATGTNKGKKITITATIDDKDDVLILDDVYRRMFNIQYTGAATTVTITIDGTQLTITKDATPTNYTFADYPKIGAMITALEQDADLTISNKISDLSLASSMLDTVTAQDIKTVAYDVLAQVQAMIDAINQLSEYVQASLKTAASRVIPDNQSVILSGAVEGTTSNSNWTTDAIGVLEQADMQLIVPMTGDTSILASFAAHAKSMSDPGGNRERQVYTGADLNITEATAKTNAEALNNSFASYWYPGVIRFNESGVKTTYAGFIHAAMAAGIAAGAPNIAIPQTRKTLNILGLETAISISSQSDLIKAGVAISEKAGIVFRVVRSVSTSQSSNLIEVENSMKRSVLIMAKRLREALVAVAVGQPGDAASLQTGRNTVRNVLDTFVDEGLLVADPNVEGSVPYEFVDSDLRISGDTWLIDWAGTIVSPVNFIFITNYFRVLVTV